MKVNDIFNELFGWVWIITWFVAIWSPIYKLELFLTGGFSLILGLMGDGYQQEQEQQK